MGAYDKKLGSRDRHLQETSTHARRSVKVTTGRYLNLARKFVIAVVFRLNLIIAYEYRQTCERKEGSDGDIP